VDVKQDPVLVGNADQAEAVVAVVTGVAHLSVEFLGGEQKGVQNRPGGIRQACDLDLVRCVL